MSTAEPFPFPPPIFPSEPCYPSRWHQIPTSTRLVDVVGGVPNPTPALDEAGRDQALARTADVVSKLAKMLRDSDLPSTFLPQVMAIHAAKEQEVAAEVAHQTRADPRKTADLRTSRQPALLRSQGNDRRPVRILRGEIYDVTTRPQGLALRVEEIEIEGNPDHWLVHDIRVGNESQFLCLSGETAPIPGARFCRGGIMSSLRLRTCQTAMDFTMRVEYVGKADEGEVFEATIVGSTLDY